MRVVAFDLNHTLATKDGLELYRREKNKMSTKVGIVTANTRLAAEEFSKEHNIDPDFIRVGFFKSVDLMFLDRKFKPDEKLFIGDRVTDLIAAKVAGWQFKPTSELGNDL